MLLILVDVYVIAMTCIHAYPMFKRDGDFRHAASSRVGAFMFKDGEHTKNLLYDESLFMSGALG